MGIWIRNRERPSRERESKWDLKRSRELGCYMGSLDWKKRKKIAFLFFSFLLCCACVESEGKGESTRGGQRK